MSKHLTALLLFLLPCFAFGQDDASTDAAPYRLQSQDIVSIMVFREPELSVTQRLDGNGQIAVPLLGTVTLRGLTIREAEAKLRNEFVQQEYLRSPQVIVGIQEQALRTLVVLGEVQRPGTVTIPLAKESIDIRDAISRVGGATPIARTSSIKVNRKDAQGKEVSLSVDLDALESNDDDFLVYENDVITVPRRLF